MSITSRINEMSSHIEQAYDELQGLGADLTNVNKNIENISIVLDDIYDSMPQVSGEGTSLTLDDTRVGKIKSTLKGNISQEGTPTPTSPIPINVVSGDNEINVVGKNLLDKDNYITDSWGPHNGWVLNLEPGTYTLSANVKLRMIKGSEHNSSGWGNVKFGSGNANANTFTFSISENFNQYLWMSYTDSGGNEVSITKNNVSSLNVQLEKGSSATTYEPYQGNTYNIDLPEGMKLCKIGNYQDYFYKDSGKWYKYGAIGKKVLNGTENWSIQATWSAVGDKTNAFYISRPTELNPEQPCYCDYLKYVLTATILNTDDYGISYSASLILRMPKTITDGNALNIYLASNNITMYFVLSTPTTTEITDTNLISQLNELEKAMSKDGQTNISQVNNDLPFIISASALKEWQESLVVPDGMKFANSTLSQFTNLNTAQVTDMSYMFMECSSLTDVGEIDTSLVTDMSYMFQNCSSLESVPNLDTSNVTSMSGMFAGCAEIVNIPHLDTSNVADMTSMFMECSQLENIPILNTANVISMTEMFSMCENLSDNSLNNILAMCANAINYEETKILSSDDMEGNVGLGLNQEQIEKCKTLSNYQAFLNAGWRAV